jgi:hypothetical protein
MKRMTKQVTLRKYSLLGAKRVQGLTARVWWSVDPFVVNRVCGKGASASFRLGRLLDLEKP